MPMDERSVFVHHIFEVIPVAHGHDVGSAPPVMLVQHILESAHGRSHDLDKDVVLSRKVIVYIAQSYPRFVRDFPHRHLQVTFFQKQGGRRLQNVAFDMVFYRLHRHVCLSYKIRMDYQSVQYLKKTILPPPFFLRCPGEP